MGPSVKKEYDRLKREVQGHLEKALCPQCGSKKVAAVLYGSYRDNHAMKALVEEKLVRMGGVGMIAGEDYYCWDCQKPFEDKTLSSRHKGPVVRAEDGATSPGHRVSWGPSCAQCHRTLMGDGIFWLEATGTICFKCMSLVRGWE